MPLGIAYSQSSGNLQVLVDGALTKRMQAGFAAKGAVLSTILAETGYTGSRNIFEGKYGLFNVYFKGKYNRSPLTEDLGKTFEVSKLSFKPYSACRLTHAPFEAALKMVIKHDIKPEQIDHIVAYGGRLTQVCCEPLDVRQNPKTVIEAQFSVPYVIARAVVERKLTLADFTPDAVTDARIAAVARKVKPKVLPELTSEKASEPAIVEAYLTDGRTYRERVDYAKGSLENPMNWEELTRKFHECSTYSKKKVNDREMVNIIRNLEKVVNTNQVMALL